MEIKMENKMKKMKKLDSKLSWKVETRKIGDLKPHPKNPRDISREGYEKLKEKLIRLSNHDILKVLPDGTVLSGNQRLKAFKDLGWDEVEVKVPSRELTQDEEHEVIIASNISDGFWNTELLGEFDFKQLEDLGLPEHILEDVKMPDFSPDVFENQGKLDEGRIIECPKCGESFEVKS